MCRGACGVLWRRLMLAKAVVTVGYVRVADDVIGV